jgi:fructose-1,6-bisphosphatase I
MNRMHVNTLDDVIIRAQARFPQATGELTHLLLDITLACKFIAREITQSSIKDLHDVRRIRETPLSKIQRLETFAAEQMRMALERSGTTCLMITDVEGSEAQTLSATDGSYIAVVDPLDGTPNIEFNAPVSTTFSVYRRMSPKSIIPHPNEALQPGSRMVVGGYVLYGSSTMLVFSAEGMGVNFFTMDPGTGEFFLANGDVRIPAFRKAFSMNAGWASYWDEAVRHYLDHAVANRYAYRYGGSMVADIHRILMEGGLFAYPADARYPNGKLHLLYKCAPLAFVVEQAGGVANDGHRRILDIVPDYVHQTVPIFIGSRGNIDELTTFLNTD